MKTSIFRIFGAFNLLAVAQLCLLPANAQSLDDQPYETKTELRGSQPNVFNDEDSLYVSLGASGTGNNKSASTMLHGGLQRNNKKKRSYSVQSASASSTSVSASQGRLQTNSRYPLGYRPNAIYQPLPSTNQVIHPVTSNQR